ncbi:MAG: mannitol dehydrogenase family protein [Planctomycetota bacterium]|jgi:mannitol-1-phosphate 5-dehydrogenase
MAGHVFTGFGFGPIQSGLFAKEAFQSGNFTRIVAAEIDAELVDAIRANNGSYYVNVAKPDGIEVLKIDNVELLNPNIAADRKILLEVLAESTEITTCLPSVSFYDAGQINSVASLIADGLKNSRAKATIIYAAENNNHAAEILEEAVAGKIGASLQKNAQFLNTVIGKMSRVVTDPAEIAEAKLRTIAPGLKRAFLVEQFNRILVSRTQIPDFEPGIEVFIEKDNLLPFEEAKLYGHNAIHSLLGFLGSVKGATSMTEIKDDKAVMQIGRAAFLQESGTALTKKYAHIGEELFTEAGFKNYAEDLLERMTNPYLGDTIARVVRDVVRKLGIDGRIFGTMRLALEHKIEPKNMALGAMAGIAVLLARAEEYNLPSYLRPCLRRGKLVPAKAGSDWRKLDDDKIEKIINWLWAGQKNMYAQQLIKHVQNAKKHIKKLNTDFTDFSAEKEL